MLTLRVWLIFTVALFSTRVWSGESAPVFVSVVDKDLKSVIGELGVENDTQIEVLDLKTGQGRIFQKTDLKAIRKDVSEQSIIERFSLPVYMAWRIKKELPDSSASGKIAQLDGALVYVTISSNAGLEAGKELIVYRGETEIKDPDTGMVLGKRRNKIAKLETISVEDRLTKAKLLGDLEIRLEVGDIVEPAVVSNSVAVLPMVNTDGIETEGTKLIAEQLTTGLVDRGVSVVERQQLDKVQGELSLQQSAKFDPSKAHVVGKQLGAYAVVVGTVAPNGRFMEAQLRLVRVETGEVLVAASQVLKDSSDQLQEESPRKDAPIVGFWVQSNGWAIELLGNGEAKNTNPKGELAAGGKWRDEGNGKYTVRLGQKSEWEWRMVLKGNTLTSEMFLKGAMFTKGTFERKGSRAGDQKNK